MTLSKISTTLKLPTKHSKLRYLINKIHVRWPTIKISENRLKLKFKYIMNDLFKCFRNTKFTRKSHKTKTLKNKRHVRRHQIINSENRLKL